jgi:hypothetical protein
MHLESEQLKKIDSIISNVISKRCPLTPDNPCICGSEKTRAECCLLSVNYWIPDKYINNILGFAKKFSFNVTNGIPNSFIKEFESSFQRRFDVCAVPECSEKCVSSHVFGKSILKKYFKDSFCQWSVIDDTNKKVWSKVGIESELGFNIFCKDCDNKIFRDIDNPDHELVSVKNQFLHTFRSLAYQYQYNRTALAIAHQIAIANIPVSFERNNYLNRSVKSEQIDITHLVESYVRYILTKSDMIKMYKIYLDGNFKSLALHLVLRRLKTKDIFFAQGIENPKVDLLGKKVLIEKDSAFIYTIVPDATGLSNLIIFTLHEEYRSLIEQVSNISGYKCKKFFEEILTKKSSPRGLLTSLKYKHHQKILR